MYVEGQTVIYRPAGRKSWISATVRRVTRARVTIDFEVRGTRLLRSVKPDRLQIPSRNL